MSGILAGRAAVREALLAEGARFIWVTASTVQARTPEGRRLTLVRESTESFAELAVRALAAYRRMVPSRIAA